MATVVSSATETLSSLPQFDGSPDQFTLNGIRRRQDNELRRKLAQAKRFKGVSNGHGQRTTSNAVLVHSV